MTWGRMGKMPSDEDNMPTLFVSNQNPVRYHHSHFTEQTIGTEKPSKP